MNENNKKKAKYTNQDLIELQKLSLDDKIALSKTRILEFYRKFPNKIYVLFPNILSVIFLA